MPTDLDPELSAALAQTRGADAQPHSVPAVAELDLRVRRRKRRFIAGVSSGALVAGMFLATVWVGPNTRGGGTPTTPPPSTAALSSRDLAVAATLAEVSAELTWIDSPPLEDEPGQDLVAMLDPFSGATSAVRSPLAGLTAEGDF